MLTLDDHFIKVTNFGFGFIKTRGNSPEFYLLAGF